MNKSELISIVAAETGISKKHTEQAMDEIFLQICKTLQTGEKVVISGFGTFEVRNRVKRVGRNPRTGDDIDIPGQKSPAFRAGKVLKKFVK